MSKETVHLLNKKSINAYKKNIHVFDLSSNKLNEDDLYKNLNKIKYKNLVEKSIQSKHIIKLPMIRVDSDIEENVFKTQLSAKSSSTNSQTSRSQEMNDQTTSSKSIKNELRHNPNVYFWYYTESENLFDGKTPFKLPNLNLKKETDQISSKDEKKNVKRTIFPSYYQNEKPKKVFKKPSISSSDDEEVFVKKLLPKKIMNQEKRPSLMKKLYLSSAQLKNVSISDKFVKDAKNMLFIPQLQSFYPRNAPFNLTTDRL